jgi:hypothetical protein
VLVQGATRRKVAIKKDWGDWFLGMACYHRNELEAATQYFSQIGGEGGHLLNFPGVIVGGLGVMSTAN